MQALILAAGRGSRLGDKVAGACKCLIEVGGEPLIEHQLETLSSAGIGPIGVVVGYGAAEVQETVGIRADYITNRRWKVTNSLYSFWLARDWVKGDVVVLNCDILFAPAILDRLLEADGDALVYDSSSGDGKEQMSVEVEGGVLRDMRKDMPTARVTGENVGMLRFSAETARALFARAEELIAEGKEMDWLGSAVREIAEERQIQAVDIAGLPWGEIDFPFDLHAARKKVWPAIQKASRRGRPPARVARWAAAIAAGALVSGMAMRGGSVPQTVVWESVRVAGVEATTIPADGQGRRWWVLRDGQSTETSLVGPVDLRIDVRPLIDDHEDSSVKFVLEVSIDGEERDWHTFSADVSELGWHDQTLGTRRWLEVAVPAGLHRVEARLIASDGGTCLVNLKRAVDDLGLDTAAPSASPPAVVTAAVRRFLEGN